MYISVHNVYWTVDLGTLIIIVFIYPYSKGAMIQHYASSLCTRVILYVVHCVCAA